MASRYLVIGSLALLTAMAASSAPSALQPKVAPGTSRLYVIGTRSAEQRHSATAGKLDSILADLSRHAALARPDHELAGLGVGRGELGAPLPEFVDDGGQRGGEGGRRLKHGHGRNLSAEL